MAGRAHGRYVDTASDDRRKQALARTLANRVSASYFTALGIAIERGRNFTGRESQAGAPVAIVSEAAARKFWPACEAVGKRLKLDLDFKGQFTEFEVIGIARDVRTANLSRLDPTFVYLPTDAAQIDNILVRARGNSRHALAAARAAVEAVDPDILPSLSAVSLRDGPLRMQRLMARAYTVFAAILAGLALVLAVVGIYGVMAYLVSQRIKEIGIRIALGAGRNTVLLLIVRQGMRPVFIGGAAGVAGAAALSGALQATLVFPQCSRSAIRREHVGSANLRRTLRVPGGGRFRRQLSAFAPGLEGRSRGGSMRVIPT